MTTFLIVLLVLVVAVVAAVAFGAMRNKRAFAKQNQIVAGTPSRAPAAWAGAHTPEALMHRRLRAAVDSAQAQLAASGTGFADVTAAIGRGAEDVDNRLIAAASLPAQHRDKAIAAVEPSVAAIENAVAGLSASSGTGDQAALDAAITDAHARLDALSEARVEVDQVDVNEPTTAPTTVTPTTHPPPD